MKLKHTFLISLFTLLGCCFLSASEPLPHPVRTAINEQIAAPEEVSRVSIYHGLHEGKTSKRVSFPTRTGFVLLRKEEIIYIQVDPNGDGLALKYCKNNVCKTMNCSITLAKTLKKLDAFPFIKISRSTIVNLDQVDEYIGTRRDAHLKMSDGSTVKVSRKMAGELHDWLSKEDLSENVPKTLTS